MIDNERDESIVRTRVDPEEGPTRVVCYGLFVSLYYD